MRTRGRRWTERRPERSPGPPLENVTSTETHLLQRALDALPQAVVLYDRAGNVVFRNRHAIRLVSPRHTDALAARALAEIVAAAEVGQPQRRTLELHGPPRRTLELSSEAIQDELGDVVGTMAVLDDVSERRHLEAVRSDFVANVSHELRTPVGALAILAEALHDESDAATVRRLAGRIGDEAERVGRMIEDLLDLSRIEAAPTTPDDLVPVAEAVSIAIDRTRPVAEQGQVRVEVAGKEIGATVQGDQRQLVSAIANLLDNAVKYSDPGSTVSVEVAHEGDWAHVRVRDQGIGIPNGDLERIFERFYRVDRARSRQTGGSGLGLSIVRHVATNHRGQVTVTSREGEGSTFDLQLPVQP